MFKKQVPNEPYGPTPSNPSFRQEVFGKQNHSQVEDLGGSKLGEFYNLPDSIFRIITAQTHTLTSQS